MSTECPSTGNMYMYIYIYIDIYIYIYVYMIKKSRVYFFCESKK